MKLISAIIIGIFSTACSSTQTTPLPRAENVDLHRFMGDWYVIANIPTFIEKNAYNALESYALNDDGTVATTFSFNKKSFDGQRVFYTPTGFVNPEDPSVWGMQFIWPVKAEYVIAYLSPDYQHTIIARSNRDYVWIMARTPSIDEHEYNHLLHLCARMGYDISLIQKVPQKWPGVEPVSDIKNKPIFTANQWNIKL